MVPLVRAKKLAPWLLPPHMAELATAPDIATAEPAKLQLMCVFYIASVHDDKHPSSMQITHADRGHTVAVGVYMSHYMSLSLQAVADVRWNQHLLAYTGRGLIGCDVAEPADGIPASC